MPSVEQRPSRRAEQLGAEPVPIRRPRFGRRSASRLAVWAGLGVFVFVALSPFFYIVSTSLKTNDALFSYPPHWIPSHLRLDNFAHAFDHGFLRWTLNTMFVSTTVAVVKLTIDSMAAFALTRMDFNGRRPLMVVMFATILVPQAVLIIPLFFIVRDLGWLDTYWALLIPPLANPVGIFILRGYMSSLPADLEHAARLDNCGPFRTYWYVILPLIRPGLVVVGIYTFLLQYINFTWPLVATSSDDLRMITTGLSSLRTRDNVQDWGLISAACVLAMVPITAMFLFFQKHFVGASMAGAIKE